MWLTTAQKSHISPRKEHKVLGISSGNMYDKDSDDAIVGCGYEQFKDRRNLSC